MRPGPDSPRETVGFLPGGCQFSVCSLCFSIFLFRLFSFWNFTKKRNLLFSEEHKKERILKIHPGKERQKYIRKVGWIKKRRKKAYLLRKNKYPYFSLFLSLTFFILFFETKDERNIFSFLAFALHMYKFSIFSIFFCKREESTFCVYTPFSEKKRKGRKYKYV